MSKNRKRGRSEITVLKESSSISLDHVFTHRKVNQTSTSISNNLNSRQLKKERKLKIKNKTKDSDLHFVILWIPIECFAWYVFWNPLRKILASSPERRITGPKASGCVFKWRWLKQKHLKNNRTKLQTIKLLPPFVARCDIYRLGEIWGKTNQ